MFGIILRLNGRICSFLTKNLFHVENFLRVNLNVRPDGFRQLLDSENYKTYYPECQRKSNTRVFFEQLWHIIKKGDFNADYFFYGLDRKSIKESDYVTSYWEFMKKRDFLNLHDVHNSSSILRNKFYFGQYAQSIGGGITTPENIGLYRNGHLLIIKDKTIIKLSDFLSDPTKFGIYNLDVFVKQIDGECGDGVYHLHSSDDNKLIMGGEEKTIDEIVKKMSVGSWIIQNRFVQHSLLSKIYPHSVNTIRMVTVKDKQGAIYVFAAVLRIGAMGKEVDNYSQGGVIVDIDIETGKLSKFGFRKHTFGGRGVKHPDTNFKYEGVEIPFFQEAMRCAKYFHSMLFDLHSIGWDIAISENGPVFIEGNDNWEISPTQMNHGIRKEFDKYFCI